MRENERNKSFFFFFFLFGWIESREDGKLEGVIIFIDPKKKKKSLQIVRKLREK